MPCEGTAPDLSGAIKPRPPRQRSFLFEERMDAVQWFKFHADLVGHPKRWRFEELAGTSNGLHYIALFWAYVCRYAPHGDLGNITRKELARACEWGPDDAASNTLWTAFVGAGFIDENPGETPKAHDWAEEHARFLSENERRATQGQPKGSPREAQGLPKLEEKRIEEKRKTPKTATSVAVSADFEQFWKAYPRKVGKGAALKAWEKAKPDLQACLSTLTWQRWSEDWKKDGGRFIPHPATWLNQSRWLDEKPGSQQGGGSDALNAELRRYLEGGK